jgi:hypothetical protein
LRLVIVHRYADPRWLGKRKAARFCPDLM